MDERKKLVNLIQDSVDGCAEHWTGLIADHLMAHGVTVKEPGYWQLCKDDSSDNRTRYWRCSVCKGYRFHNGEMRRKYKHCPNCGAEMKGESNA